MTRSGVLRGKTVVVTRPVHQAEDLSSLLEAEGADVIRLPLIAIADPDDGGAALRAATADLSRYDWIVFTSANGVERFFACQPVFQPSNSVACVGTATAAAVESHGIAVDLIPAEHISEALVAVFPSAEGGGSVLLPVAAVSRDVLAPGLRNKGWDVKEVASYRTVTVSVDPAAADTALTADVLTFTSSSAVDQFIDAVGRPSNTQVVASIGPVTTERLHHFGLVATVEAEPHTVNDLVDAIKTFRNW